ncbi:MAG: hypothetical protein V2A74_10855 [bacterium]
MTSSSDPKEKIGDESHKLRENLRQSAQEIADGVLKSLPPKFVEHMGNAAREVLLATRHLLDRQINGVDKAVHRSQDLHRSPSPPSSGSAAAPPDKAS